MSSRFRWVVVTPLLVALALFGMVAARPSPAAAQSQPQAVAPCPAPEAPNGVEVCVDRGDGAVYHEGDPITICVTVNIPVIQISPPPPAPLVRVTNSVDGGPPRVIFEEQMWSDQRCITMVIRPPLGQEIIRAEVIDSSGRVLAADTAWYTSVPRSAPPSTNAAVTVTGGPGSVHAIGEPIQICYTVPGSGRVSITDILPDGRTQVLLSGYDDGTGGCFWATITPPAGTECLRLDYATSAGSGSTQTCFQVVATTPPSQPCIQIYPPPPGCESPGQPITSHGGPVRDYVSLIDNLRAAGATVEPVGEVSQPFFSVPGYVIEVNGEQVQVFEYADEAAANAEAATVSPDGSTVGRTFVGWVAPPHFFTKGRIIVLYAGSNQATLELLQRVLGPQFAGR